MILMQYEFTLPADYDMTIIRNRVRDKGHFLDHHQPLLFKAYLVTDRGDPVTLSQCNLYAPFYLWRDPEGLADFLLGPGFRGVSEAFGRPTVRTWPVVLAVVSKALDTAVYAVREIRSVPGSVDLSRLQEGERLWAHGRCDQGDLLALSGLEPSGWSLVRFRLAATVPALEAGRTPGEVQVYDLLHLSNPSGTVINFPEISLGRE